MYPCHVKLSLAQRQCVMFCRYEEFSSVLDAYHVVHTIILCMDMWNRGTMPLCSFVVISVLQKKNRPHDPGVDSDCTRKKGALQRAITNRTVTNRISSLFPSSLFQVAPQNLFYFNLSLMSHM